MNVHFGFFIPGYYFKKIKNFSLFIGYCRIFSSFILSLKLFVEFFFLHFTRRSEWTIIFLFTIILYRLLHKVTLLAHIILFIFALWFARTKLSRYIRYIYLFHAVFFLHNRRFYYQFLLNWALFKWSHEILQLPVSTIVIYVSIVPIVLCK